MLTYNLLFENEEQYLHYCNLPDDPVLLDRLNMDIIEEKLCEITPCFPATFIRKMNPDASVAEYRMQIFRDLTNGFAWKKAEELSNQISSLRMQFDRIKSIVDPIQNKIVGIHVAAQYFDLLDQLCAFALPFESVGLRKVYNVLRAYLAEKSTRDSKEAIYHAESLLDSNSHVCLSIDRYKKIIVIERNKLTTSDSLQNLDILCQELTGISVLHPFTVVDASSPTLLERLTINHIFSNDNELAAAIQNVPKIEMLWEYLNVFQVQINFYIAFIKLFEQLKESKLPFCYPTFNKNSRLNARNIYDLSLSIRKMAETGFCQTVNDVGLNSDKFGFILTGANQGGKTTYLRAIGIIVYLSMSGCPVPAENVALCPYQAIFALFGGQEDSKNETSRFEFEIKKYCMCRDFITSSTFVLLNEYFTGTNRLEAVGVLGQCINELIDKKVTYGCVTHFQEICEHVGEGANEHIVYLRAMHNLDNDESERYSIELGHPDGKAYSERIAEKVGMTYDKLIRQFEERGIESV